MNDTSPLQSEIANLRSQLRWTQTIGLLLAAVGLLMMVQRDLGAAGDDIVDRDGEVHEIIQTRRFELLDEDGIRRIVMDISPNGSANLSLQNEEGNFHILLSGSDSDSDIWLGLGAGDHILLTDNISHWSDDARLPGAGMLIRRRSGPVDQRAVISVDGIYPIVDRELTTPIEFDTE